MGFEIFSLPGFFFVILPIWLILTILAVAFFQGAQTVQVCTNCPNCGTEVKWRMDIDDVERERDRAMGLDRG